MKKRVLPFLALLLTAGTGLAQLNTTLLGHLPYNFPPGKRLSNIGGYVDAMNNEYALVGTPDGLSIVDVNNPMNPAQLFMVPTSGTVGTSSNNWREVKTMGHYAYVTTEAGGGLQIIDLSGLPASYQVKAWTGDGAITGQLNSIHALHVDAGFAYLYGNNIGNRGFVIADLTDPWNPTYAGSYDVRYVHDGYVRNNKVYACEIYQGTVSVIDVTNKSNPTTINFVSTPTQFPHNSWLSDDSNTMYTTDENSSPQPYLTSWDISDLNNIVELDRIQSNPGSGSITHNVHVLGNYLITSYYRDGFTIHDATDPSNLIEVGNFDPSPLTGAGYDAVWGVYPDLPSGIILVSDRDSGLYIVGPNYQRACYLNGNIIDFVTQQPVGNVNVEILGTNGKDNSKPSGDYKTGWGVPGNYDVKYSKVGYADQIVTGVTLASAQTTIRNIQLVPSGVGITESSKNEIRVFPNPFNNAVTIDGVKSNTSYLAEIMDAAGRVVLNANLQSNSEGSINWTTGTLKTGVHVVRLTNGEDRHLIRISVK